MNAAIIPRYKILINYDILAAQHEAYYRYILGEFVPTLRTLGIHMLSAWHIAYGDYPSRQLVFITENKEIIKDVFASERWQELEERLKGYTIHYTRKVVNYEDRFQF